MGSEAAPADDAANEDKKKADALFDEAFKALDADDWDTACANGANALCELCGKEAKPGCTLPWMHFSDLGADVCFSCLHRAVQLLAAQLGKEDATRAMDRLIDSGSVPTQKDIQRAYDEEEE